MGTSNFSSPELTSKIYAIGLGIEEGDYFDIDEELDCIIDELDRTTSFRKREGYIRDGRILGYFYCSYYDKDRKEWEDNTYNIVVKFGYYEGAQLDIIEGEVETDYINKTYEKRLAKEIKDCEKVFAKFAEGLKCIARFSNGETMYAKA